MKVLRALVVVALLVVAMYAGFRLASRHSAAGDSVAVYYVKPDGTTLAKWNVSLNPKATDAQSVALYATTQAVAGPPVDVDAIRFPAGTVVRSVHVAGGTATVDLGGSVTSPAAGSFSESGEFKGLVWTLTALPGISRVAVTIDGAGVATLPGGHFELDEALARTTW